MTIVPDTRRGKVQFYEAHLGPWQEQAESIGLDAQRVGTLASLIAEARAAYDDAVSARLAARAATNLFYQRVEALHAGVGGGSELIETIKTFAHATGDRGVYSRAQIPAPPEHPPRRGSAPPPGTPGRFRTVLLENGAVEVRWDCRNPGSVRGTMYEVRRQLNSRGEFAGLGTVGVKRFVDDAIPAGTASCVYEVIGVRSAARGTAARFTVHFGRLGAEPVSAARANAEGAAAARSPSAA